MARETFYPFYSLPLELRMKIWASYLPPRNIRIKFTSSERPVANGSGDRVSDPPRQPLPAPFHVCQQSRIEMEVLYQPLTSTVFKTAPGELVNLNVDTVLCDDVIFDSIHHRGAATSDSGNVDRWEDTAPEQYYAEHSPLSLLSSDAQFASSVTSLVLPAAGLKAIERGPGIETLDEMKANNRMSKNMICALRRFPALRELKILLNEAIDFQLPGVSSSVDGVLKPVSLCYISNRCYDCCRLLPGLKWVDDWTWRVKCKVPNWKGPVISFACLGTFSSNCWEEGHPEDCIHCIWDRQLDDVPDEGTPPSEWLEILSLLEV